MLTQEQGFTPVQGLNCYDVMVVLQIMEKALANGLVTGKEIGHVAALRMRLVNAAKQSIGVDLDNPTSEAPSPPVEKKPTPAMARGKKHVE